MADSNLGFGSNPYLQKSIDDSLADTTRAYNMTAQPAFNNAMVRSGSFGNSGVQQMNEYGQQQLQNSLGRQANDMRSQNYQFDQQFDRGVYNDTFGQQQQQFQNGLNLLGMQSGANTQNLGLGTQIQNTPLNYYQGFNQQANSIGQGYGTSSGSSSASGSPLMGALGGYQLGNSIAKNIGGTGWGGGGSNPQFPEYGMGTGGNGGWV